MRFISHDSIASNMFNDDYCSANGTLEPWQQQLTNSADLIAILVDRMQADYLGTHVKLRKPFNGVVVVTR